MNRKTPIILLFLVVAFSSVALAFFLGRVTKQCPVCPPEEVDFSLLWEAWHKLEENYVDSGKLDTQKMIHGAISGMVESIGDPHTVFFNPGDTKIFLENAAGEFEGVGMEIGIKEEQLQVISPLKDTPAERAGLRPGDKIVKIDGQSTDGMSLERAVALIRGKGGTEVVLTIMRNGWDNTKDFAIERAEIKIPPMDWNLIEGDIAHIEFYHFSKEAPDSFSKHAVDILNSPAKKIILDLRGNPGGYLHISQDIASWFIEKGKTVVIEEFADGERKVYETKGSSAFSDYPMVVLINEGSASAAEILTAALREHRGAEVIGTSSFGKSSIQQLTYLQNESSLKITIAHWLTPDGTLIPEDGIRPDIEVDRTEEDYNEDKDPQLDKAIETIKKID